MKFNYFPFFAGILLVFMSAYLYYFKIWKINRSNLPNGDNFKKSIEYIISYSPFAKVIHHILAGISLFAGLGLIFGYGLGLYLRDSDLAFHSGAISISSAIFSVLTAMITFWTLNQTKKIDLQQGYRINDFKSLISHMNKQISWVHDSYIREYNRSAQEFHRVFIITEHPFFGTMSFPDDNATLELKSNFRKLKDILQHDKDSKFIFQIVCGNTNCIESFINNYHESINDEEIKSKKVISAKKFFESEIKQFSDLGVVSRKQKIPTFPQFAIIGNNVYEFIIQAESPQTEIIETHVVMDRNKCKLYIETFNLLKDSLSDT